MREFHRLLTALPVVFAASGCGPLTESGGDDVITMYVAPERAPCKPLGGTEDECILVRGSPDAPWEPLVVGEIRGFTHELGDAYTLLVKVREVDGTAQPGYRLVRVVKREQIWPDT